MFILVDISDEITSNINEKISLSCDFTELSMWFKDNLVIYFDATPLDMSYTFENTKLVINNTQVSDTGIYICRGRDGKILKSFNVTSKKFSFIKRHR